MAITSKSRSRPVTVAAFMPVVEARCPPRSWPTYHAGFARLAATFATRSLRSITTAELIRLRDEVREDAAQRLLQRARSTGRPLRSYDESAHGRGAAENFVRAARLFFRLAVTEGHLSASPATAVPVPRRPEAPERALSESELADLYRVAATTGEDCELDTLLLRFLRETAARRSGALNLALGDLDERRGAVTLTEKAGTVRDVPCSRPLLRELRAFGRRRGAQSASDPVFRYRDGHPLTRRRFNSLFDRIDRNTTWTERLDVGAHWIRHTTLTDIALVSDVRVASAYAGHRSDAGPTILRYTKVTFDELAAAHAAIFGPTPEPPQTPTPSLGPLVRLDPAAEDLP